jgi:hypothetical protein
MTINGHSVSTRNDARDRGERREGDLGDHDIRVDASSLVDVSGSVGMVSLVGRSIDVVVDADTAPPSLLGVANMSSSIVDVFLS